MNKEVNPLMLIGAVAAAIILVVFFAWRSLGTDKRAQVSTTEMAQHQTQTFNQQAGILKSSWVNGKEVNVHFH